MSKSTASKTQPDSIQFRMKFLLSVVGISTLSNIGAAQLLDLPPLFDPYDPKFDDWQPAGPNDSRGPCPGLNSLANHGFLPRSGKNITVIDIVRGTYLGLGLSPDASVAVGVAELIKSYRLAAFDLHELSNHGFVEHDCSLSRADFGDGNNNDFNETIWSVPLEVLMNYTTITPQAIGAARSARDLFDIAHNPNQQCGARSIAVGALENGLLIQSLGGKPPLEWVRSIFEQQRIPTNLGFRPEPIVLNNLAEITAVGLTSLLSQPNLTYLLGNTVIKTPADLLAEVFPVKEYDLTYILEVLGLAGFPSVDLSFLTGA
ncbi:HEME_HALOPEROXIDASE domain-containing protein [Trichoderma simmonsii]|uniref:HEME_HALOPEROXIDASE domain-containing protein n=1 Tax=Trichoderma simmonsii TaxID=1491479 RepID=A0A8G0PQN2_9HYPO|nr:HEME_HALOPEROXIDASE domain-containing protein [Trichoderma simmonsii]